MIGARLTMLKTMPRTAWFAQTLLTASGTNCKSKFTLRALGT